MSKGRDLVKLSGDANAVSLQLMDAYRHLETAWMESEEARLRVAEKELKEALKKLRLIERGVEIKLEYLEAEIFNHGCHPEGGQK